MLAVTLAATAQAELLSASANPDFEQLAGDVYATADNGNNIAGWNIEYTGTGFAAASTIADETDALPTGQGTYAVRLNNATLTTDSAARVGITPGTRYELNALIGNFSDNQGAMRPTLAIDWFDASGELLSSSEVSVTSPNRDAGDPLSDVTVSGVAPADAAQAGVRFAVVGD